jgi:predicted RNA-binding protein Jag
VIMGVELTFTETGRDPAGTGALHASSHTRAAVLMAMISQVMEIPNGPKVNFVIGRGGSSINAIQTQTGTHVNIQPACEVAAGAPNRQVTISGTEEAIARCRALIRQRVGEYELEMGGSVEVTTGANVVADSETPVVLHIPNGPEVNHLIGAKGASVNALQAETGTHISIQRASDVLPGCATRTVTITGANEASRSRCAELVLAKVVEYSGGTAAAGVPIATCNSDPLPAVATQTTTTGAAVSSTPPVLPIAATLVPTLVTTNLDATVLLIPNGPEVNFLIGAKGASINAIQTKTGAHISVQRASEVPPGGKTRTVTITGLEGQRALCAELVRHRIAEYALEYPDGEGQPSAKRRRASAAVAAPLPPPPPPSYGSYSSPSLVAYPPGSTLPSYPPSYYPPSYYPPLLYEQPPSGYSHHPPPPSGSLNGYAYPPYDYPGAPPLYLGHPPGQPMFTPHAYPPPSPQAPVAVPTGAQQACPPLAPSHIHDPCMDWRGR